DLAELLVEDLRRADAGRQTGGDIVQLKTETSRRELRLLDGVAKLDGSRGRPVDTFADRVEGFRGRVGESLDVETGPLQRAPHRRGVGRNGHDQLFGFGHRHWEFSWSVVV